MGDVFRFKQFDVKHEKSPMKVNTDSVLLGAWVNPPRSGEILDIGTGNGLLALMCAQRFENADITGVEIIPEVAEEADYNFKQSPWKDRLHSIAADIKDYVLHSSRNYDLVISNPPFYNTKLMPVDKHKQIAKHTQNLTFSKLFELAAQVLNPWGVFAIVVPIEVYIKVLENAKGIGLVLKRQLSVRPTCQKETNRFLLEFSFEKQGEVTKEKLTILCNGQYTAEYLQLTKDYYLFA